MRNHRFGTGAVIPSTGIYRVIHRAHRLPHEATLFKGETFPKCQKCGYAAKMVSPIAQAIFTGRRPPQPGRQETATAKGSSTPASQHRACVGTPAVTRAMKLQKYCGMTRSNGLLGTCSTGLRAWRKGWLVKRDRDAMFRRAMFVKMAEFSLHHRTSSQLIRSNKMRYSKPFRLTRRKTDF
jgi:hypothetical protein